MNDLFLESRDGVFVGSRTKVVWQSKQAKAKTLLLKSLAAGQCRHHLRSSSQAPPRQADCTSFGLRLARVELEELRERHLRFGEETASECLRVHLLMGGSEESQGCTHTRTMLELL